jgi:hypothetical protein
LLRPWRGEREADGNLGQGLGFRCHGCLISDQNPESSCRWITRATRD